MKKKKQNVLTESVGFSDKQLEQHRKNMLVVIDCLEHIVDLAEKLQVVSNKIAEDFGNFTLRGGVDLLGDENE